LQPAVEYKHIQELAAEEIDIVSSSIIDEEKSDTIIYLR
jgi:hypothetical protein